MLRFLIPSKEFYYEKQHRVGIEIEIINNKLRSIIRIFIPALSDVNPPRNKCSAQIKIKIKN